MDAKTFRRWAEQTSIQEDGCILWTGAVCPEYPMMWESATRRVRFVHHLVFEHFHGPRPKSTYVVVEHTCERKLCVSPAHLALTTQSKNVLRRYGHNVGA